jgi:hypothetical protein
MKTLPITAATLTATLAIALLACAPGTTARSEAPNGTSSPPATIGAPSAPAANPRALMTPELMLRMGAVKLDGPVPAYHSPGYEERARELQRLLAVGMRFYADSLALRAPIRLALLDAAHWQALPEQVPYGVPFYAMPANLVFLPASRDNVVTADYLMRRPDYSAAALARIAESGLSFEEGAFRTVDLIGYHELGHIYTHAYGIRPPTRWLSEFLATYFAYAVLAREMPALAALWDGMTPLPDSFQPRHTSLDDFERLYFGVGPENYFWYQGTFSSKVSEVFAARGLAFLREMREAFPVEGDRPSAAEALERVERVHPGFAAWARGLEG